MYLGKCHELVFDDGLPLLSFQKIHLPQYETTICQTLSDPEFKTTCRHNPSLTSEKCPWRRLFPQDPSSNTQILLHQQVTAAQQTANTTKKWLLKYKCLVMQIQMSAVQCTDNLIFSSWVIKGKTYSNYLKISTEPSLLWSTPSLKMKNLTIQLLLQVFI